MTTVTAGPASQIRGWGLLSGEGGSLRRAGLVAAGPQEFHVLGTELFSAVGRHVSPLTEGNTEAWKAPSEAVH